MKRRLCAILLIAVAGAAAIHGSSLDGHVLHSLWRGTLFVEGAVLLTAFAAALLTRGSHPARLALGSGLAAAIVFLGAQHFARAARRNAMAEGALPESQKGAFASVEEIRGQFARCFPPHADGKDEFYELELGIVPPSPDHPQPRWLLTQPYAPMAGASPGFLVACAYLRMKSARSGDTARQFADALKAAGLDPTPFIAAAQASGHKDAAEKPKSSSAKPMGVQIPDGSTSVLAYPAHAVPEIDAAALVHPNAIEIDPADLHEMNYGWELVWISRKHPRIGLHTREGAGDFEGQHIGVGDFHGLHLNRQMSEAVYDFKVARAGYYSLTALILPEADKCSNYPQAAIDGSTYADLGHNGCVPYEWYDANWIGGTASLGAGWHQLHLHFMQDGLTIARYWLTPVNFAADLPPGAATPPKHPPVELILTRRSMSIQKGDRAEFGAWVCNNEGHGGAATLDADIDPGRGRRHITAHWDIELDANTRVQEFPISVDLPANLPAREMRVTVTLAAKNPDVKAVRESTLVKPFPALLLGAIARAENPDLSIFNPEYRAPKPDGSDRAGKASAEKWGPYPAGAATYYGLYDLNRAFGADSKEGLVFSRAYLAMRLDVPKTGNYLFKIMGDDGACVWIDGQHIYSSERKGPPIRYPGTVTHALTAGRHLLVMHCDQTTGWWQCGLHLRTENDDVCDIEGVEP